MQTVFTKPNGIRFCENSYKNPAKYDYQNTNNISFISDFRKVPLFGKESWWSLKGKYFALPSS